MEGMKDYETRLVERLLELCGQRGLLDGMLLNSPDITVKWETLSAEYAGDAVREFNGYPEVVLAWSAYIGMAVACWWDKDWIRYKDQGYDRLVGERGFDDLDEHVTRDILKIPLASDAARKLASDLAFLAGGAYSFMLHKGVDYQSVEAFNVFRETLSAMYRVGAAIELKRLGYKMELM